LPDVRVGSRGGGYEDALLRIHYADDDGRMAARGWREDGREDGLDRGMMALARARRSAPRE